MGILAFTTKKIGIDPGSQNLRIIHDNELVFNEPNELSIDHLNGKVSGFGYNVVHASPNQVITPINVVIGDFHAYEELLRLSLKSSLKFNFLSFRVYDKMYISMPLLATKVDQRAYRDVCEHAGAKNVFFIHQPYCSALEMGILFKNKDFVLIDFSASKVEVAVLANSSLIAHDGIRIGTWRLQKAIGNHLLRTYQLKLNNSQLEVLLSKLPHLGEEVLIEHKTICTDELRNAVHHYILVIEDQIKETLEKVAQHQSFDRILKNGLYFTGGGSKYNWIVEIMASHFKMNFTISSSPQLDNINGLKKVMENPDRFKDYLTR